MVTINGNGGNNSFTSTAADETFNLVGGNDNQVYFTAGSIGDDIIQLANDPAFGYDIHVDLSATSGVITGTRSGVNPDDLIITVTSDIGGPGATVETITLTDFFLDNSAADQITITTVSGSGTFDLQTLYCFSKGTMISTPSGETKVEELHIGDAVLTADDRSVPVKWIGHQTVSTWFGPAERLMPVRFVSGSLGNGLPHTDLTVTADHGMLVDGVICHAGALVNGSTITQVPLEEMGKTYSVYHIETEAHEIILANGAPAETFIDNVSRRVFDNFAEFEALYGDVPEMEELPYPRAMSARQVPGWLRRSLSVSLTA
ncbi:Hint domain-containing protein [Nioella aestuarii]|uniref:Hint domain-containing protein n=1 Tax=Nioella aestuarii TaxID=1662864 RepID=UPI003D7F733A